MTVTVGSLCTGVGGLDLGITAAYGGNTRLAWYSELNPDACTILAARLPGVPNLGDLTAVDWTAVPRIDLLCAGFPCQPVSAAGRQKGTDDERWLWPHVRACYRALMPQELVFENVRNLVSIQKGELFAEICANLREDGYAVRWGLAGACAVGGAHHRHRVFVIARYAWQLNAPPAERVDMIECGARRGKGRVLLPTPTASSYGRNKGGQNPDGPIRWSLDSAHHMLPTPGAYDGDRGGSQDADKRKAGGHSVCLQDAVHGLNGALLLPTPVVSDSARGPNPPAWPADNLTTAVDRLPEHDQRLLADTTGGLLPTPRATDTGTPGRRGGTGFRPPLSQVIAEQTMLPTPIADDAKGFQFFQGQQPGLETAVRVESGAAYIDAAGKLLPTPTCRDHRTGYDHPRADGHPALLNDVAQQELLPTPRARDAKGDEHPATVAARIAAGTFHGGDSLPSVAVHGPQELLPTPRARDMHGGDYNAAAQQTRRDSTAFGGPSLPDVVQQNLLPTPRATTAGRDCDLASPSLHAGAYGADLLDTVAALHGSTADPSALLPTPRHSDAAKGSPNQHGSAGDLMLPSAVIGARYGRYAHAVALWEHITGQPAPEPTVKNKAGQWRLNPALPEWMMGYPTGWITDLVGRSAALRGAGNGVVPQVVAAVYPVITAGWPYLRGGEVCPDPIVPARPALGARAPRAGGRGRTRRAEPAAVQLELITAG